MAWYDREQKICEACGDACGGTPRVKCRVCGKRICSGCRQLVVTGEGIDDYKLLARCADHGEPK